MSTSLSHFPLSCADDCLCLLSPSVTAILTSRFILDLHHAADTLGAAGDDTQYNEMGTLAFYGSESATTSRTPSARPRDVYGMVFTPMTGTIEREREWDAAITPEGIDSVSGEDGEPVIRQDIGVAV